MDETQRCGRCKEALPVDAFAPSYRGKTGTWCRACFAAYHRGEHDITARHDPRRCEHCDVSYVPRHLKATAAYCSRPCKDKARRVRERAERLASKPTDRRCIRCEAPLPREMRTDALFCSAQCSYKAHSLPRSLRTNVDQGVALGHVRSAVFERDGWRCGICQRPVDRELRYPDPMCPSLDHIVPVSAGGTDDPSNLRCTHLLCNITLRNAGAIGQQVP